MDLATAGSSLEIWGLIGLLVGIVMGLTGAGGAIVSVPLFIHFSGHSVFEATIFSLYAVTIGATFNWYLQRKESLYAFGLIVAAFSLIGSWAFSMIKPHTPSWVITILFSVTCSYSLFLLWNRGADTQSKRFRYQITRRRVGMLGIAGVFLGSLSTMTGLGGGAILMPWLVGKVRVPPKQAVPTSLLATILVASGSIISQWKHVSDAFEWQRVLALAVGILLPAWALRLAQKRISQTKMHHFRKWTFTAIIAASVSSLLYSLFQ